MKLALRTIKFVSEKKVEKPKTNKELNLLNEYQFDMDWWNKNFAIEWWSTNGHFNDTLYRDYLLAKIKDEVQENNSIN